MLTFNLFQFETMKGKQMSTRSFPVPHHIMQRSHVVIIFVLLWPIQKFLKLGGVPAVDRVSLCLQNNVATKALATQSQASVLKSSSNFPVWSQNVAFGHTLKYVFFFPSKCICFSENLFFIRKHVMTLLIVLCKRMQQIKVILNFIQAQVLSIC